jgi:tRNA G18 (ribose-2'-O)-methylase SpoU
MKEIEITSFGDPRVDVFRNIRDADLRGRDGLFMAESELVVRRLLRTPQRIHSLLLSREKFHRMRGALGRLPDSIPVYVADLKLMHEIAAFHIHRGVLAAGFRLAPQQLLLDRALGDLRLASRSSERRLTDDSVTIVLAEGITNVDNMGALFRNAAAFGVNGLLLDPACCDPLYRKAIRVSMGHTLSIPYAISQDWRSDLERLKREWGLALIAAESTERAVALWNMPKACRVGIVVGSEGHGIAPATLDICDAVCAIPMAGNVSSINVAVASAVVLYELRRPREAAGDAMT